MSFPVISLLLISNFVLVWLQNILFKFCLFKLIKVCFIGQYIVYPGKFSLSIRKMSIFCWQNVLQMSLRSSWFLLFQVFCFLIDLLCRCFLPWLNVGIAVSCCYMLCISLFISVSCWLMCFGALLLRTSIFIIVTSSSWIDSLIFMKCSSLSLTRFFFLLYSLFCLILTQLFCSFLVVFICMISLFPSFYFSFICIFNLK